MPEVTIKPAGDIVPGVPSWFLHWTNGGFMARVWLDENDEWHLSDAYGLSEEVGQWRGVVEYLQIPADTPEPVVEERGETVEVRIAVIVLVDIHGVHYGAYGDSDYNDATSEGAARICHGVRVGRESLSWVTARVPLPAKPAEVVGEVSDG